MIVGPIQFPFMYCEPRGSPTRHISSERIACRHGVASAPPYAFGQLCVSQPRCASAPQNSRENAACASLPGPWAESSAQFAGRPSSRNARSSRRYAASPSDHSNSKAVSSASDGPPAGILRLPGRRLTREQREPAPAPHAVDVVQTGLAHPRELRLDRGEAVLRIAVGAPDRFIEAPLKRFASALHDLEVREQPARAQHARRLREQRL